MTAKKILVLACIACAAHGRPVPPSDALAALLLDLNPENAFMPFGAVHTPAIASHRAGKAKMIDWQDEAQRARWTPQMIQAASNTPSGPWTRASVLAVTKPEWPWTEKSVIATANAGWSQEMVSATVEAKWTETSVLAVTNDAGPWTEKSVIATAKAGWTEPQVLAAVNARRTEAEVLAEISPGTPTATAPVAAPVDAPQYCPDSNWGVGDFFKAGGKVYRVSNAEPDGFKGKNVETGEFSAYFYNKWETEGTWKA